MVELGERGDLVEVNAFFFVENTPAVTVPVDVFLGKKDGRTEGR